MTKTYRLIRGVDTLDDEGERAVVQGLSIIDDRRIAARVIGTIKEYETNLKEMEEIASDRIGEIRAWVEHKRSIYHRLRDGLEAYLKYCENSQKIVCDVGQAYLSDNPDKLVTEGTDEEIIAFCKWKGWDECVSEQLNRGALKKRLQEQVGQKELYRPDSAVFEEKPERLARLEPQGKSLRIRWNE